MLRNFLKREKGKEHQRSQPSSFSQLRSRLHHTPSIRKASPIIKIVKMSTPDIPEGLVINRPQEVYTGEYRNRAGPVKVESSLAPIQEEGAKEERLTMREASVEIARVAKELDDGWAGLRKYVYELEQKAEEERERALAQETEEGSS